jgi:hypothetical protein
LPQTLTTSAVARSSVEARAAIRDEAGLVADVLYDISIVPSLADVASCVRGALGESSFSCLASTDVCPGTAGLL